MGSMIAAALGALFRENAELIEAAKTLAGLAACRPVTVQRITDLLDEPGEQNPVVQWSIHFNTVEDARAFDDAVQRILVSAHGEE